MRRSTPANPNPRGGLTCPYCESEHTHVERERGPGLCRTVHYCEDCQQPFEEFS